MDNLINYGMSALSGNGSEIGGMSPLNVLKQFDRNGDNTITEEDFVIAIESYGLGQVGEYAVKAVFGQLDTNGNGKLELMEAYKAFQTVQQIFNSSQTN